MKLLCYEYRMFGRRAGVLEDDRVVDLTTLLKYPLVLRDVKDLILAFDDVVGTVQAALEKNAEVETLALEEVKLRAPIQNPSSVRDCAIFEQHVVNAGRNHGYGTPATWYERARYYFGNPGMIGGPGDEVVSPVGSTTLDFESEICMVIGKEGHNVTQEDATHYIFGFTIFNDWSDRDLCNDEVGYIGLAKGKDFNNSFGPWVVTYDEMERYYDRETGKISLKIDAWINGEHFTDTGTSDMYYSIPYLIERISKDSSVLPGDLIGLGTPAGGCIYELPKEQQIYLKDGDRVKIQVEGIGVLEQTVKNI